MTKSAAGPMDSPENQGCGQAYALFAVSLLLVVTIGSAVQLLSMPLGLTLTELVLILLPAVLFVRRKGLPIAPALGWRRVKPASALLGVVLGVTGWGVAASMQQLTLPILGEPPEIPGLEPQTLPQLMLIYFCAALLPGICEETLFRGAIQGLLWRRGSWRAVGLTALLFALFHVNPWVFLPALFLGVVFGSLVVRTGSVVPAMLSHVACNATAFTVSYLFRDQPDASVYPLLAVLSVTFCAACPVFWRRTRDIEPDRPLLSSAPAHLARPGAWVIGLVGGTVVLAAIAAIGLFFALVTFHTMPSDELEPEVQRGDLLVILNRGILDLDLQAGDIITFQRDGETVLRRASRIEEGKVWIREGSSEVEMDRARVTGKVVHHMKGFEAE